MKSMRHLILSGVFLFYFCAGFVDAQRITFDAMPDGWSFKGKPFTKESVFEIQSNPDSADHRWLSLVSSNASGSIVSKGPLTVDLKKTPILRWRWRVTTLPKDGDGRYPNQDDQAIGIYISSGSRLKQQSIAYRWETLTPAGTDGSVQYAKIISVKWFAIRDQCSVDGKTFFTEERNLADDFKAAFGMVPDEIGIGISCNSQFSETSSAAQLDWIEFCAPPSQPEDNAL
ncbi:MAG: DUF3047 domain-containing protein [Kiritimatiellaceae bacterium]|nr:DUF3047 domain-containing protein [Kiritimatiellaceae bacterium]